MRVKTIDRHLEWRRADPFLEAWKDVANPFICHFGGGTENVTQTSMQNATPWAPQQPFLTQGFQAAGNLLTQPPPQQQNPVVGFNPIENSALSGIAGLAASGTPISGAANNFATSLENGAFLNSNPALGYFGSLAGNNLGLNNPGAATLQKYANGGFFSGNGYADPTAQTIMSQVIPQVAAAFNGGNNINNPAAAYAAGQGVTAALAPLEYNNYQTQEQLQQNAANTLGTNAISGGNLQATAAQGISQPWQQTISNMVQGNALAPQDQALNYANLEQLFGVGQAAQQQAQNEASGAAATFNYSQLAPYQQLADYIAAINGNYGGTTSGSSTTPYFTNPGANIMSGALGGSMLASAFPETFGALGGALGLGGGAAGAGLGALISLI